MMQTELFIAIIAGLAGMFGWGLADFFAKKTIDRIGDVQSLAWAGVFGTAAFLAAIAYQSIVVGVQFVVPTSALVWGGLIFFGALQAMVYLFAYNGFGKGEVAVLAPVFSSFTGWTALVSIAFLGEPVTTGRLLALTIIFIGLMLLSVDYKALAQKKFRFGAPGFTEVVIATLLAAVWTLLWDQFVAGQDAVAYAFWMFLFMTIAVFVVALYRKLPLAISSNFTWTLVALIGVCETIAYLGITVGYSATSLTSVVALVSGAFALPTMVLAMIFLNERPSMVQNIGSIITIIGIALLSLA
jgi:drug/metabolite transporter (DMT)-like permease